MLAVALLAHVAIVINYIRVVPAFDWPDAPAHAKYVCAVAARGVPGRDDSWDVGRLEELTRRHFRGIETPDDPAIAGLAYENHQPPLYFLAAGGIYRVTGSLLGVRLLNVGISCVAIVLLGVLAMRVFPRQPIVAAGAIAFGALHPMRAYMAGSLGNDPLSELMFTIFVLAMVREAAPWKIGLLAGLGLLTKVHLLMILPLYGAYLLATAPREFGRVLRQVGVAAGVALLVAMPWLLHNLPIYGWRDPLALHGGSWAMGRGPARPTLTWAGPYGVCAFATRLYQSWWGVFGWMNIFVPAKIAWCFLLLVLLPFAGLVRMALSGEWRLVVEPPAARVTAWLVLALTTVVGALIVYSVHDYQAQGRYLLTAFPASAFLFGLGWRGFPDRVAWIGLGVAALLLAGVNVYICHATIPWYLAR